jgi:hypothetical protein
MNSISDKSNLILNRIYEQFHCPGRVYKWEESSYIAEVYNVSPDRRDKMKDDILALEDEIFPEMDFFILPMVYTTDETMEYFFDEYQKSLFDLMRIRKNHDRLPNHINCSNASPATEIMLEDYKAA